MCRQASLLPQTYAYARCGENQRFQRGGPFSYLLCAIFFDNRFHQWKKCHFTKWPIDEKCKKSFTKAKATRRWHPVLEHFDKFPIWHHSLGITLCDKFLLFFKSCA